MALVWHGCQWGMCMDEILMWWSGLRFHCIIDAFLHQKRLNLHLSLQCTSKGKFLQLRGHAFTKCIKFVIVILAEIRRLSECTGGRQQLASGNYLLLSTLQVLWHRIWVDPLNGLSVRLNVKTVSGCWKLGVWWRKRLQISLQSVFVFCNAFFCDRTDISFLKQTAFLLPYQM